MLVSVFRYGCAVLGLTMESVSKHGEYLLWRECVAWVFTICVLFVLKLFGKEERGSLRSQFCDQRGLQTTSVWRGQAVVAVDVNR